MKAIIEAKEELRKIENEFTERISAFHGKTGLIIRNIDVRWIETTRYGDQYETAVPHVKIEILIKGN
jgi:hypothetical protein